MRRHWIIMLLILAMPLASIDLIWKNPVIGGICNQNHARCRVYTSYYQGYLDWKASGTYHSLITSTEDVSVLEMANGTLLRLIFYCKSRILVTTRDKGSGTFGGYEFCETVPFEEGTRIFVVGTLVTPSAWNSELTTPKLVFAGDLYVFDVWS